MAKKHVETYSLSNSAAQDPEESVQLTNVLNTKKPSDGFKKGLIGQD